VPDGPLWPHEIKHDGYRFIGRRDSDRVRLFTRRGLRLDRPGAGDRGGAAVAPGHVGDNRRGVSEELIAEALAPYRDGLIIATKGDLTRPGDRPPRQGTSRESCR
jgi:hypothetical protein